MGKIIRRVIAILLAATGIIIAVIPAGYVEATSTHGDYEYDGSTLVKYLGSESVLTIPNWITKVGKDAFANNTSLRKINLPDSVSSIDYQAFEGCINLQEAVLPESVRTIGSSAFSGCSSLYSVNIPRKCETIGSGAFAGCPMLSDIRVDDGNESFVCIDGVLYSKDGSKLVQYLAGRPFTGYTMPTTNKEIEEYAFWGSGNLRKLNISPGINSIPEYAFAYCSGLSQVTLPSGVERINAFAFADCSNLESINIPESVGFIDDRAFYLTDKTVINFVDANGNVVRTVNSSDVSSYGSGIDESVTVDEDLMASYEEKESDTPVVAAVSAESSGISTYVFPDTAEEEPIDTGIYNNDTNQVASDSANTLGSGVIVGGSAMLLMPSQIPVKGFDISEAEQEDNYDVSPSALSQLSDGKIGDVFAGYNGSEANFTVPSDINRIGVRAFYKNRDIETVNLPAGLESIGDFAFARSSLNSISIPDGTKSIDYAAFYGCKDLTDASIPASVEKIALGAFEGTPFLDNFKNSEGDDFLIVGDGILLAYKGSGGDIVIPDNVKHIAAGAFYENSSITGVVVPGSVKDIGEDSFCGCKNLRKLNLLEGVRNIEDRAFKNSALPVVVLPDSLESVGLGAFDTTGNGNTLKTVIITGNDIPNVSYNETATRLSAGKLRTKSLEGVGVAIVSNKCDLSSGTLFDPKYYGFEGVVYSEEVNSDSQQTGSDFQDNDIAVDESETVEENSNVDNVRTLLLEKSLIPPDEEGNVVIDPHVDIAGTKYIMGNVKSSAFECYKLWNEYFDNKPQNVLIDGNRSKELDKLIGTVLSSEDATGENVNLSEGQNQGNISQLSNTKCELRSNYFNQGESAVAVITDSEDKFNLLITDCNDDEKLSDAFKNKYGYLPEAEVVKLNFELTDKTGTVPIHKLGNNRLEVEMPLPQNLIGLSGITVGTLDDNGMLEEISTDVAEDDAGVKKVRFVAGHCSVYCIYSKEQMVSDLTLTSNVSAEEALGTTGTIEGIFVTLQKDTPVGIPAKWFVVIILFALAGVLALYKPVISRNNR